MSATVGQPAGIFGRAWWPGPAPRGARPWPAWSAVDQAPLGQDLRVAADGRGDDADAVDAGRRAGRRSSSPRPTASPARRASPSRRPASTKPGSVTASSRPSARPGVRRAASPSPDAGEGEGRLGVVAGAARAKPSTRAASRFSGDSRARDRMRRPGRGRGCGPGGRHRWGSPSTGLARVPLLAHRAAVASLTAIAASKRRSRAVWTAPSARGLAPRAVVDEVVARRCRARW